MKYRFVVMTLFFVCLAGISHAQNSDPLATTNTFSDKMIQIIEGPITKFLAAIILLAGVGGLLRGRHKLAISCGVAFIILLSIPLLIPHN